MKLINEFRQQQAKKALENLEEGIFDSLPQKYRSNFDKLVKELETMGYDDVRAFYSDNVNGSGHRDLVISVGRAFKDYAEQSKVQSLVSKYKLNDWGEHTTDLSTDIHAGFSAPARHGFTQIYPKVGPIKKVVHAVAGVNTIKSMKPAIKEEAETL